MQPIIGCSRLADEAVEHSLDGLSNVWICTLATANAILFLTRVLTTLAHLYNLLKTVQMCVF